jgi:hypothetical protein
LKANPIASSLIIYIGRLLWRVNWSFFLASRGLKVGMQRNGNPDKLAGDLVDKRPPFAKLALAMGFAINRCGSTREPTLMTPTLEVLSEVGHSEQNAGPTGRTAFPVGLFLRPSLERLP